MGVGRVIFEEIVLSQVALVGMQVHGYTFLMEPRHQTHKLPVFRLQTDKRCK